jgi:hypothetical protein
MKRTGLAGAGRVLALLILGTIGLTGVVRAQSSTGTLRGTVKDETGATVKGAEIQAVEDDSGLRYTATSQDSGFYNVSLPPGRYTVTASSQNFAPDVHKVVIGLGQTQGLDFDLRVAAKATEAVTVSAQAPLIETKSNEIATNVTEQQLQQLPQDNRNFLNFARLAPGVRYSDDPNRQEITAGANEAFNTNVFIDGTSYKNDVLLGGVVGQDSSRGNPFPQNAVQEFRVITQNFKAEYEKSSSAIITAVTKSGTNDLKGDAFTDYQNKGLVAFDPCSQTVDNHCGSAHTATATKPDYTRWQAGVALGGPIVKDSVHFFGSWELNDQNRANIVTLGSNTGNMPPSLLSHLQTFQGTFGSPFKSNLLFGKASWQAAPSDVVDASGFWRHETDVRDFGSQRSFETATDIKQDIWNAQVKNAMTGSTYLSETTMSYQSYKWNPSAVNPNLIGLDYNGVLRVGGQDSTQLFNQKRFTVREDFSLFNLHGAGDHVVKAGLVANFNDYKVRKDSNANPIFSFNFDASRNENFDTPYQAIYGFGNADLSSHNNQYGIYVQDDWTVTPHLTVNAGLRWDYETNDLNNNYVTPALVVSELQGKVPPGYFTDGTQRPTYKKAFQPRIGFAYDVTGKGQTVVFGGWGRYYDRNYYNALLDEKFRLQYSVLTFRFSNDGLPRDGAPTIMWNPSYLSVAGLQGIIASGKGPKPQVFLINNDTKPPVSDEFSVGIRQSFGIVGTSISYAGSRSRNGFTNIWNNFPCCQFPAPDFDVVLISDATKKAWYDALLLSVDKPYTASSKWGATLSYTFGHGKANGGDLFSLDYVNVAGYPIHPSPNDERHRIVASGILGLPWDVRLSTFLVLGSGLGYTIQDSSLGFGPGQTKILLFTGKQTGTFPYQEWDVQLGKDFFVTQNAHLGVRAGVFNVTNHANYGCFDGFIAPLTDPGPNKNFGKPGCTVTQPRLLQVGATVGF